MSKRANIERGPVAATTESAAAGASDVSDANPAAPTASGEGEVGVSPAERAMSVLRAADPSVEEPLPSTRPDGCAARMRESNLDTAAPTVRLEGA